ncbi:MAG: hypothetical protein FWH04_10165, partial [Oscillospiraceae bacterium]|nr:hypothetical protein [Oscillospiraceae bacterium]
MNRLFKRMASIALIIAILCSFSFMSTPANAAVVTSWAHIGFMRVESFVSGVAETSESLDAGAYMQQTSQYHHFDGTLRILVRTGSTTGFQVSIDSNVIATKDMQISRTSGIDPLSKVSFWNSEITITNVSQHITQGKNTHILQIVTRNPSSINTTSMNNIHIRKFMPPAPLPPAPATVDYSSASHMITGVSSAMEYRLHTTAWSGWASVPTGATVLNVYPQLSTTRETKIEVRTRSPQSESRLFEIPALEPAPVGLSIVWSSGETALIGVSANTDYTISADSTFSVGNIYWSSGSFAGTYLTGIIAGDILYVRVTSGGVPSAYVSLVVPPQSAPNAGYNPYSHSVTGLNANMDIRVYTTAWSEWIELNSTIPILLYNQLSAERETKVEIRYWNTPAAVQTIIIPALEPAPEGLWLDWVDGRPVVWGLGENLQYTVSNNINFMGLVADISSGIAYGAYLDTTYPDIKPGDTLYARVAPNTSSASSAHATLIVPASITATANEGGTVSGGGNYAVGETVELTATPDDDYTFDGWYEDGARISTDETYSFTATVNRTLEARFAEVVVVTEEPPTEEPTEEPTEAPTEAPTEEPTQEPTEEPSPTPEPPTPEPDGRVFVPSITHPDNGKINLTQESLELPDGFGPAAYSI